MKYNNQVPTREEFYRIIEKAKLAGQKAAKERYEYLRNHSDSSKPLIDMCGGALLILKVDGRSKLGKFMNHLIKEPLDNLSINTYSAGRYDLSIKDMAIYQERSVCEAAEKAALSVIEEAIGIEGYISGYDC
jgi:hypothetical protein